MKTQTDCTKYNRIEMVYNHAFLKGNNPMVGATVAVAVAVQEGMNK